jgi:hypothetical protein
LDAFGRSPRLPQLMHVGHNSRTLALSGGDVLDGACTDIVNIKVQRLACSKPRNRPHGGGDCFLKQEMLKMNDNYSWLDDELCRHPSESHGLS